VFDYNGTPLLPGSSEDFVYTTAQGCDSTVVVSVSAPAALDFDISARPACPGASDGSLELLNLSGGAPPLTFALNGLAPQDSLRFVDLEAGDYTVVATDAFGCTYSQTDSVQQRPSAILQLRDAILACDSSSVQLQAELSGDPSGVTYLWHDGSTAPSTVATQAGPIWVEIRNICGVQRQEAAVLWADLAPDEALVYVPNALKPAADDPQNAELRPVFARNAELLRYRFQIFDRWGNMVFESNNPGEAWRGQFDGSALRPGVLIWHLEADVRFCGRVLRLKKDGDAALVR
jgi:hypothetical protein